MEITLVPQPTVTGYLITEKIRPAVQSFSSGSGQQTTSSRHALTGHRSL